ncbi:MAG: type II secretion system major pseudopilin GspG [Planctomycetota bacterium]
MRRRNVRGRNVRGRGFSLLELLLVLVILAVLAGIVGVRFAGQSADAKIKAAGSQLETFKLALGTYELRTGAYPTTAQGLEALITDPGNVADWPGRLLDDDQVPVDQWGNAWQYRAPGTQNTDGFDLFSFGPDGKQGGGDDIANWSENR